MIDKKFFKKYQDKLVWFINTKIGRWFFCVDKDIRDVHEVMPNALGYEKRLVRFGKNDWRWQQKTCFRTHNKYAKLINHRLRHFQRLAYLLPAFLKPELGIASMILMPLTVSTFYPDSGTGSTTVDGYVGRTGVNETFSNIIGGAGTSNNNTATKFYCQLNSSATTDQYQENQRPMMTYDTSAIDTDDIDSAVLSLYGGGKLNQLGDPDFHIAGATPASDNILISADYSQVQTTSFGSNTYASISSSAYNDFTLNASGESNINKTGISKFSVQMSWDITATPPTWSSDVLTYSSFYSADQTGTAQDPKLVVTHTVSVITKILTETITTSDTISNKVSRVLSETISLAENFTSLKILSQVVSDTITTSDTIIKSTNKVLSDTVNITETFIRYFVEIISDSITITEDICADVLKIISETITITENFITTTILARILTETITITESIARIPVRIISEAITITENITKVAVLKKILTEAISMTEQMYGKINGVNIKWYRKYSEKVGTFYKKYFKDI